MDTGKNIISDQKRIAKSGTVTVQLAARKGDVLYFNVLKDDNSIKYIVRTRRTPSEDDYCTCLDFLNRNTPLYVAEHGYALQCKHLIKCKKIMGIEHELYLLHLKAVKTHMEALSQ